MIKALDRAGVNAVLHYVPLHDSPAGRQYGRAAGDMAETRRASDTLVRLPLWPSMTDGDVEIVVQAVRDHLTPSTAALGIQPS
jgi:dTDP-4-amino-4,6-dideoxygalactose transaminase